MHTCYTEHGLLAWAWSRLGPSPLCPITASRLMTPERETAYLLRTTWMGHNRLTSLPFLVYCLPTPFPVSSLPPIRCRRFHFLIVS